MTDRAFECTLCGACCRRGGSYVFFSVAEVEAASARLNMTPEWFAERFLDRVEGRRAIIIPHDSACPFLLDDACTIQDDKPSQCRTYPFWPEIIQVEGAWEAEAAECPGIGRGKVYTRSEIERLLEESEPS